MSGTTKISIARALVELKSLGGRIERAATLPVVSVVLGEGELAKPNDNTFKDLETVEEEADTALVTIYRNGEVFTETGDDVLARIESYVKRTVKEAVAKELF